jgi:hypothetical protein
MNFLPYIGKPIVLITNEVNTGKELENMELPGITYLMHSFSFPRNNSTGGKFCIVRDLVPQDLEDEDFSIYLKNMWTNDTTIETYLGSKTIMKKITNLRV